MPLVTNGESSIGIFNNCNKDAGNAGQCWLIGSNLFGQNPLTFSIGTAGLGNALTIDILGTVTINSLDVNYVSSFGKIIDVTSPAYYGQIHISHSTDGNESGIGFFSHTDRHMSVAGDCWVIGSNIAQYLPNCFSIYCNSYGNCLTIDQYINTTLSNILRVKNSIEM